MAWAPLLLALLTYCIGLSSQQLQSVKPTEFVSPGETVILSCPLSSGAIADNNYPFWVQQRLGNTPRLIMYSTSTRPSGIPERFTGSRSGNTMSLTITGALAEDDADYYCAVWTGSAHHSDTVRWGSDTKTFCGELRWLQSPLCMRDVRELSLAPCAFQLFILHGGSLSPPSRLSVRPQGLLLDRAKLDVHINVSVPG